MTKPIDAAALGEIRTLYRRRLNTMRAWNLAEIERRAALDAISEACERYGIPSLKFYRLARGINCKRLEDA